MNVIQILSYLLIIAVYCTVDTHGKVIYTNDDIQTTINDLDEIAKIGSLARDVEKLFLQQASSFLKTSDVVSLNNDRNSVGTPCEMKCKTLCFEGVCRLVCMPDKVCKPM